MKNQLYFFIVFCVAVLSASIIDSCNNNISNRTLQLQHQRDSLVEANNRFQRDAIVYQSLLSFDNPKEKLKQQIGKSEAEWFLNQFEDSLR